jgi:type VI secretion system protein ImpC
MAKPWSLKLGEIVLGSGGAGAEPLPPETPFRILVLGNFSGSTGRGALAERRALRIDRDNFEETMARLGTQLHWRPVPEAPAEVISFRELDDFHPDHLFTSLDVFASLRRLRDRLDNPSTFEAAAAEVRSWTGEKAAPPPAAEEKPAPPPPADAGKLLDQILAGQSPPSAAAREKSDWDRFLGQLVAPHLTPDDARQEEFTARVDEAVGAQMRGLLHHPDFQGLEAAWRGLFFLTRRLETDAQLQLHVLDVSREELAADLGAEDPQRTALYKVLVEETVQTPGAAPWAVVIGAYTFGPTAEDVELLGRLAALAARAGAPFLAGADSLLAGCRSLAESPEPDTWTTGMEPEAEQAWQELRGSAEAAYLGLALPRFLLRLPYGAGASETERFSFEELPAGASHEDYLWGNPAFAIAYLLGTTFQRQGWGMRPGVFLEVDGLPLHVHADDGESRVKPCAEVVLRLPVAEALAGRGLMTLLSFRDRDAVQLAAFRSLSSSGELRGRWG